MRLIAVCCVLAVVQLACADIYLHNPRGANNRLNEQSTNNQNNNRLFDSQNNAKGGYCISLGTPSMSFYEGSILPIEWTNQHACGTNPNVACQMVLQYMCGTTDGPETERIRNGQSTDTPANNADTYNKKDADGGFHYGMHESYTYYQECRTRGRNKGLYTADKNLQDAATRTRQNQNGNQNGFECPEERDYYPYWATSPWRDIAILTSDTANCPFYKRESRNVKGYGKCDKIKWSDQTSCVGDGGVWSTMPAWGIPEPDCQQVPYSRDNHLGNTLNGFPATYNWTLPSSDVLNCVATDNCVCVFRIRYNVSSYDFAAFPPAEFVDSKYNNAASPIKQDPTVTVEGRNLSLAMNTNQYSRTFQDRSHTFSIRQRPSGVSNAAFIYNLNVRGKRGNIVQVYPAVEYDFVPSDLVVRTGDYVHFQWVGCNDNPSNNAGEGTDRTDRSNVMQIKSRGENMPLSDPTADGVNPMFEDAARRRLMGHLTLPEYCGDNVTTAMVATTAPPLPCCPTYAQLKASQEAGGGDMDANPKNCAKLNPVSATYFDAGLIKVNKTGNFHYMSTRNNNLSNRSQKGTLTVVAFLPTWAIATVAVGATLFASSAAVGGAVVFAKMHPTSAVASYFARI